MKNFFKFGTLAAIFAAASFFTSGCMRSKETKNRNAVEFITAQNLEETVVGMKLSGQNYVFGLENMVREEFNDTRRKFNISKSDKFEDLLKQGNFDKVSTNVTSQLLAKAHSPFELDTEVFRIEFTAFKKYPQGEATVYLFFVMATSPEACGITEYGGNIQINGKDYRLKSTAELLGVVGTGAKENGVVTFLYNENVKKEKEQKTPEPQPETEKKSAVRDFDNQ